MVDSPFDLYVCSQCKGTLQPQPTLLHCATCSRDYPIVNAIPDFLLVRPEDSANSILHDINKLGRWAWLYDTSLWYPLVLTMYAGWGVLSFTDILAYVRQAITPVKGLLLDVATGPGVYGRRLAGQGRTVYGIDISLDMMRLGQAKVQQESISGMNFARADVEALPFGDQMFSGGIASGGLHLFPDPHKALLEINRTLQQGAPLVVLTFIWSDCGALKYEWARRRVRDRRRLNVLELAALPELLDKTGFEQFIAEARGGVVLFTVRKR